MHSGELLAGRFVIEGRVAAGGMGTVYQARDAHTGQPVAVKVLESQEGALVERFLRESRVLSELRHPGIVRYVAHGESGQSLYLAMEWLEGESLEARLERGPLGVVEAVELGRQLSDALGFAHGKGVVHRDVKPSNVVLRGGLASQATLIDFGVARLDHAGPVTHSGVTIGTPGYMAPEQARGAHEVDARADVFALGCVLFECLAGRPAFVGAHVMAVLAKILLEEAPQLSELRPEVPGSLDALVARMLAKDPAERPASGAAVAAELDALAAVLPAENERGAPAGVDASQALTRKEQRLVSVLLSGGAGAAKRPFVAGPAPAEARARANEARSVLSPSGVHVEALADGSIVGTLVGAGDATAQVARAARAALAARARLPDAPLVLATGRGVLRGRLPIGEVIDRAATMVRAEAVREAGRRGRPEASSPRGVRIDETTAGLLGAGFEVRGDEGGLWLRGEREGLGGPRTLLGRASPFVGRARELGALADLAGECFHQESARAALITGAAGAGKSRLRYELLARLAQWPRPPDVWLARGDPMGRGAPFGLLAQLIRREAHLLEGEPVSAKQQKLIGRLGRHLPEPDARRAARFLGELVGASFDAGADVQLRTARHDPMVMGDQLRRAWELWAGAELTAGPLLIVLEDAHWGDLSSMTYIEEALSSHASRPLLVVAVGRPELRELFPELFAGSAPLEVRVDGLPRDEAARLARSMLGERAPSDVIDTIVERASGNAFFLEELIRASASGEGGTLPAAVLAVVQARLEALEPEARRALRAASVFGPVFWASGVELLLGGPPRGRSIASLLGDLERAELIARRDSSRYAGEEEYEMSDAPVREAAYEMLTERDRETGHALAADWLERAGERSAVLLAEHHERGGRPARARQGFLTAAREALEGNDFDAALAWADRAERAGGDDHALGLVRLLRAETCRWAGQPAAAEPWALGAMDLLPEGSDEWLEAAAELASAAGRVGHTGRVVELCAKLGSIGPDGAARPAFVIAASRCVIYLMRGGRLDLAEGLLRGLGSPGDGLLHDAPEAAAWLARARSLRASFAGHPAAHLTLLRASVSAFERAGDARSAWTQRANVGAALTELGENGEAELLLAEVVAAARSLGLGEVEAQAKQTLGVLLGRRAAVAEARATVREAVAFFAGKGSRRPEGVARAHLAGILLLGGDREGARKEAERAVGALAANPPGRAFALAVLARALLAAGAVDRALPHAADALATLEHTGGVEEGEPTIRLVHAQALRASGEHEASQAAIAEAERRLNERAGRIVEPSRRQCFLKAVPDNAATLRLAGSWLAG